VSSHPFPSSLLLAAGLALGVMGDALLRVPGAPALNLFIWTSTVAVVTVLLHRRRSQGLSTEGAVLLGLGVIFAAGLAWRDSPALKLVAIGGAAVCFALPAFRAGAAWMRSSRVSGYITALSGAAWHAAFGAALAVAEVDWEAARGNPQAGANWRRAAGVARGAALAVPFIVVFGGLFISADAVFAGLVADIVRVELDVLASHVVLTLVLGWIAAGYLRGSGRGMELHVSRLPRPQLTMTELGTVLALVGLLFLVFVIVQFRYLFGGSALVHVTPGLTYAEYARRGFFELVAVVVLMLPLLLLADWVLRRDRVRDEVLFRAFAGAQIVLVLAVLASALQRMRLYQATYGLTELRFYVTATLLVLGVVLVWFTATVLRGKREAFAFGTLVVTLAAGVVLFAANPDAIIARTNIARMNAASASTPDFDVGYVASLSADAVPVLLAALPALPSDAECRIARRLLERWPPGARVALRTWNWSDARARREVEGHARRLREIACR
jgi:hypothetical protein